MPNYAHHSFAAEFDRNKTITVTGTVQKLEWTNPHARLYVEGKDETGKMQTWDFELGPPNGLMRNGWNRNSLKPGHEVTVNGFRSKTSTVVANARAVKLRGWTAGFRRIVVRHRLHAIVDVSVRLQPDATLPSCQTFMTDIERREFVASAGMAAPDADRGRATGDSLRLEESANVRLVSEFCAAWATRDLQKILASRRRGQRLSHD